MKGSSRLPSNISKTKFCCPNDAREEQSQKLLFCPQPRCGKMQPCVSSRAAPLFTLPLWPALGVFLQVPETMPAQGTGGGERLTIGIADTLPSRTPAGLPTESRGRWLCPALLSLHWAAPLLGLSALSSSGKTAWGTGLLLLLNQTWAEMDVQAWGVLSQPEVKILPLPASFAGVECLLCPLGQTCWPAGPLHWLFVKGLAPRGSALGAAKWCLNNAANG